MDIRQLRYFIGIVEAGSFSRAAIRLRVAQPALSQHVLAMEAELGVALLLRSARGVTPTEEGLRLVDEARVIGARIASLPDVVRGRSALPSGAVRFGMPGTLSEQLGVPLIEATKERFPDIGLRITEAMSGFVLDWLRDGVVDVALLFDVADTRGLTRHEALTEEIVLFGIPNAVGSPSGDRVALKAALRLPLVLPSPSHGLRMVIDAAALSIGAHTGPGIEIDSYRQIKQLAARGTVFGMLPRVAIRDDVASGRLREWRLRSPSVRRRVVLAYRTDRSLSSSTWAVADLAWRILRGKVLSGAWQADWTGVEEMPCTAAFGRSNISPNDR